MRHGKPSVAAIPRISAGEFSDWVDHYNASGVCPSLPPPQEFCSAVCQTPFTVCSDLLRSIESAKSMGIEPVLCLQALRELDMPYGLASRLRLKASTWMVIHRLLWWCGFSRNSESRREAKERAATAADTLIKLASMHQSILFIGHGWMNRYIAKELKKRDWQGPASPGRDYWQYGVYRLANVPETAGL